MRKLLVVLLLLVACVGGLGFYRGWFTFATSPATETEQPGVQLKIDKDKMMVFLLLRNARFNVG